MIHKYSNKNLLLSLMSYIDELVLIADLNDQILDTNHALEKFLNINKADLIGTSLSTLGRQLNITILKTNNIDHLLACLPMLNIRCKCTINNEIKQISWSCLPMLSANQQTTKGLILIGYKSTISRKINNNVDLLDNIVKYSPDWIYWKDKNSIHLGCNDQFAKAAGFLSHKEMIGKSDHDFPWKDRADKYVSDDKDVIKLGIPKLNIEDTVAIHDGSKVTVISNKVPLRNSNGQIIGVLGIATDISHLKKIEENLLIAKETAESASHAKTEFIANMGHDVRTPLTGIIGLSQILEEVQRSDEKELATMIHECGEQLLGFLNGVLDLITVDATNATNVVHESFDVRRVFQDVLELELPAIKMRQLEIKVHIDDAVPLYVVSDKTKLHRILLNLASNAIKFTNTGHIELNARLQSREDDEVQIEFSVRDTGIGIPDDLKDKIFDEFFKITPSYKGIYTGNGIGLHIVQKYVSLLGGEIDYTSQVGVGTTFSFVLPMKIGQKPKGATESNDVVSRPPIAHYKPEPLQANPPINPSQIQVLLVEDNIPALTALKIMMKKYGVQAHAAVDAESAFDLVMSQPFDLIITDIGLPGKLGDELTRMIRTYERDNHLKPTKIVGLTGHALGKMKQQCLDAGMNDVYRKPISSEALNVLIGSISTRIDNESSHGALGEDLPDTEAQLFDMEKYPLFDLQVALHHFGSESVARDVLTTLKMDGITDDLARIKAAHECGDWGIVEKLTHKIKGGACYGTVRLYYALLYMERYLKAGHMNCAERLYAQMLRVIEESMVCLDDWLKL